MANNIFNPKLTKTFNDLGIKIKDKELFLTAFTHTSYANEHKATCNERLEFLGDAILDFLVGEYLYLTYKEMPEGELSKIRSKYVCTQANAEYALFLKLDECLRLGKGEREQGGKSKPTVLADLFEAFLGALYLDSGLDSVRKILNLVIYDKIEYIDKGYFVDYKSKLQEDIQAESRKGLEYHLDNEEGPSHDKTFTVSVFHDGVRLGTGVGKSKKEAEQAAAHEALNKKVTK